MRIARLIIISIVVFFIIITIISFFIPSQIRISKAIEINSTEGRVMTQLSNPRNWKNWYPGADSSKFYYLNDTLIGLVLDSSRRRSIVITAVERDEVKAMYLLRDRQIPMGWQLATAANSVTVEWYIDFHLRWYPWEKFTSFLFQRVYSPQLQQGLDNLKTCVERGQQGGSIE